MRGNPWKSRDLINILVSQFDSESILNSKPILELMNRKGDTNTKCYPHQKQKIFLIVSNRVTTIKVKKEIKKLDADRAINAIQTQSGTISTDPQEIYLLL